MGTINEFGVIDFKAKQLQRNQKKESAARYKHIKSKCQPGNVELLDSLVDEVEVTEEAAFSVMDYMKSVHKKGFVATDLFMDSILLTGDDFYSKYEINWFITIDDALTYLAMVKQKGDDASYQRVLKVAVNPNYPN